MSNENNRTPFTRGREEDDHQVKLTFYVQNHLKIFTAGLDKEIRDFAYENKVYADPINVDREKIIRKISTESQKDTPKSKYVEVAVKGPEYFEASLIMLSKHEIPEDVILGVKAKISDKYKDGLRNYLHNNEAFQVDKSGPNEFKKAERVIS